MPDFDLDFEKDPWTKAARITGFRKFYGFPGPEHAVDMHRSAESQTWVHLYYDSNAIWLGFRCEGISGAELTSASTERDGKIWRDPSVEFFFDPEHSHVFYYHGILNFAGGFYDEKQTDKKWNAPVMISSSTDENGWSAFVRFPFSAMDLDEPRPGDVWSANFCRSSASGENSTWAPTLEMFTSIRFAGHLIFGGEMTKPVRFKEVPSIFIGDNNLLLDEGSGLSCRISDTDSSHSVLSEREQAVIDGQQLPFPIHDDRIRQSHLDFSDEEGNLLATLDLRSLSPIISERIRRLNDGQKCVSENLSRFPKDIQDEAQAAAESVKRFTEPALRVLEAPTPEQWKTITDEIDKVELSFDRYSSFAETLSHFPNADFALGLESPMNKVMIKASPFTGKFDDEYSLSLAKNEHEAFQVVVMPFDKDLTNANVSVSCFRCGEGYLVAGFEAGERRQLRDLCGFCCGRRNAARSGCSAGSRDNLSDMGDPRRHAGGGHHAGARARLVADHGAGEGLRAGDRHAGERRAAAKLGTKRHAVDRPEGHGEGL